MDLSAGKILHWACARKACLMTAMHIRLLDALTPRQKLMGVAITAAILGGLFLYYDWSRSNRFTLLNGKNGVTYRIDRANGETLMIHGSTALLVRVPGDDERLSDAPVDVVAQIHGRGGFEGEVGYGGQSVYWLKLHNSSNWLIQSLRVSLFREREGQTEWSRTYAVRCDISPESTERVSFETIDGHLMGLTGWRIISAKGSPAKP